MFKYTRGQFSIFNLYHYLHRVQPCELLWFESAAVVTHQPIKAQWLLHAPPGSTVINCVLPIVHLCVLCGSLKKQVLFPYLALTDGF